MYVSHVDVYVVAYVLLVNVGVRDDVNLRNSRRCAVADALNWNEQIRLAESRRETRRRIVLLDANAMTVVAVYVPCVCTVATDGARTFPGLEKKIYDGGGGDATRPYGFVRLRFLRAREPTPTGNA